IPDLLRPADHETAFSRLSATVHIAVAHAPPLMRSALLLDDTATVVDPRRPHEVSKIEIVGEPIDAHGAVTLELVHQIFREIGVGTLVVDIDSKNARLGHGQLLLVFGPWQSIHQSFVAGVWPGRPRFVAYSLPLSVDARHKAGHERWGKTELSG